MIALLQAIVLGIIEGITEFLPISSTGHLILAEHAMNFTDSKDLFTVVIQLGAIVAVLGYFRQDLWKRAIGLYNKQPEDLTFWKILIIGTVPAGIFGLVLDKSMERLTVPLVIAVALIIGGVILWFVDRKPVPKHEEQIDFSSITVKRALLIGLGQCVAIIPGVSRSGATIVSGLLTGLNRTTATAFSFYLSIPVIVAASAYKLIKYGDSVHTIPGGYGSLTVGLLVSFVTAWAAVAWLLKYISSHTFRPFAYYRIALGTLILVAISLGMF